MQKKYAPFFPVYLTAFFFALQASIPLYVNSSFLGQFLPEKSVGLIFTASSVLTIFLLAKFPNVLNRFGNYKTTSGIVVIQSALLVALALSFHSFVVIPIFIAIQVFAALGFFSLDIFLERFSSDNTTGVTRGVYLTIMNGAVLLGPLVAGIILSNGDFGKIYFVAALMLVPALYIITKKLRNFADPAYHKVHYIKTLMEIVFSRHPKDAIRHVVIANLLLWFFYAWMIIYTPLYLHNHIGFEWNTIGVIFAIMLLPFVLFELPVGALADRIGEKGIMVLGFIILSFFTAILFFIREPSVVMWAAILFCTRVGASFVEITSESYFFKHIQSADAHILSVFRNSPPFAYIVAPLIAFVVFAFASVEYLFLVLSVILLYGIWIAWNMTPASKEKNPA